MAILHDLYYNRKDRTAQFMQQGEEVFIMKNKTIGYALGAIIVLAFIGISICLFVKANWALRIDDYQITEKEYISAMNQEIYDVTRYFYEKEGVSVDKDFWEKEINGEFPYKKLADETLEQLTYEYAVYSHAQEMGYIENIGYEAFLKRLKNENQVRADRIANGQVVYGLSEFNEDTYKEYEFDLFQKAYCDDLNNPGMRITDEERREYYEENKDVLFVAYDDLSISYLKVHYETEDEGKILKDQMTQLYKKMDSKHSLEELALEDDILKEYFEKVTILSDEYSIYVRTMEDVMEYAMELQKGESTQVEESGNTLYLVECTNRVDHDYKAIEDVVDFINTELRKSNYSKLILERASSMKLDGNMEDIYLFTKKNIKR